MIPLLKFVVLVGALLAPPCAGRALAALQVEIGTGSPRNQPVGSTQFWGALAPGSGVTYQFSIGTPTGPFLVVRDYSPRNYMEWTSLIEGVYTVRVRARSADHSETGEAYGSYIVFPRVTGSDPGIFSTPHPLVALYSIPAVCETGVARVIYRPVGSTAWQVTGWKVCRSGKGINFYVAGLYADTDYEMVHQIVSGPSPIYGPLLTFRSGVPTAVPLMTEVIKPAESTASLAEGVVLHGTFISQAEQSYPYATDLNGNLVWYYDRSEVGWQTGSQIVRPVPGGTMLLVMNEVGVQWQVLREIDLAGNTLRETTVARVNEQLAAMGKDPIGSFHHEALRLPNGHTLVLGSVERLLTDVQGPGEVDVLGDAVIDLDYNLQVVWAWNAFDHLDPSRAAVLGETCTGPSDGCRPLKLAAEANDWTHANAITYSPNDGHLLVSLRHQDWVIKIAYDDGTGDGSVVWRLGPEGDFTMASGDPFPWFSHQHDPDYDGSTMVIYDNGNTRCGSDPLTCQSRGQVIALDENALTATLDLNVPLGHYAHALGNAKRLSNGNYHFGSGWVFPGPHSEAIEFLPDGTEVYRLAAFVAYRSFRMRSLYFQ